MMETAYMNYFNVNHCGLYKVGLNKAHGCELGETFDLIQSWVKGRSLASTIPWDPMEARRNRPKCYCKDIYKCPDTGDFLVVLWKSDTDGAGTLWGAQEDTHTGVGEVVKYTNEYKGKKVIWGRPCYYWIIPELDTVVSLKFDHSVCDAQLFEEYVVACITNRVNHENKVKDHTEKGFVRISYKDDTRSRFMYRFNMSLKSLNTASVELKQLAAKVTHIIRRETILVDSTNERAEWVKKFTDIIPFVAARPKSKTRKIEVTAEARPTAEEIKKIIETNAQEGRKPNDWDNVGFGTESGVTWVDRYRLRDSISVGGDGNSIFSAQFLYSKIHNTRQRFLRPLILSNLTQNNSHDELSGSDNAN